MRIFFLFLAVTGIVAVNAQTLSIKEVDLYGKERPVKGESAVVDINSRLILVPDFSTLSFKTGETRQTDEEFVRKLDNYKRLLQVRDSMVSFLDGQLHGDITTFAKLYVTLEKILKNDFQDLQKKLIAAMNTKNSIRDALTLFNREVNPDLSFNQEKIPSTKTVTVKATLFSKGSTGVPVHVKNYDNLQDLKFWRVNTWETELTPEEQAAIDGTEQAKSGVINKSKKTVSNAITSADVPGLIGKLNSASNANSSFGGPDKTISGLGDLTGSLKKVQDASQKGLKDINSGELNGLLEDVEDARKNLTEQLKSAPDKLKGTLKGPLNTIQSTVDSLKSLNRDVLEGSEKLVNKGNKAVSNFTYYDSDEAPATAFIDLESCGPRSDFDVLKIEMEIRDSTEKRVIVQSPKEIELSLLETTLHAKLIVGTIFANPFVAGKDSLRHQFQVAPAAHFIFKWGSRHNRFINQVQPGIGISVSTPDFDLNAIPDVSIGVVGTIFRDLLSLGISYNTAVDAPFWFFGVSLPIGLPIIGK